MPSTHHRLAVLDRRREVAARYLKGEDQYQLARALGVTQQQISLDLKVIEQLWLDQLLDDFDKRKALELAKIDANELRYLEGWERSLLPREVSLTEATEGGEVLGDDGKPRAKAPVRKASMRREGQAGDPRFLDGIMKCIERRCSLLGLDAPQRYVVNWEALSDEQLERLAQGETPQRVLAEA